MHIILCQLNVSPCNFRREIFLIKIGGIIRTVLASLNFGVALTLFMAITFLTYVGTGHELTPRRVIVTLSLLTFLRNVSGTFLIRSVFLLSEAKVAFTRIQVTACVILWVPTVEAMFHSCQLHYKAAPPPSPSPHSFPPSTFPTPPNSFQLSPFLMIS